jgi:hypothetical protein
VVQGTLSTINTKRFRIQNRSLIIKNAKSQNKGENLGRVRQNKHKNKIKPLITCMRSLVQLTTDFSSNIRDQKIVA